MGNEVAAAVVHGNVTKTTRLPNKASVFIAELHVISLALSLIHHIKEKNFITFSDSMSSLEAISGFTVFSGILVAPEYKPHPLFLPKIWEKFIDKSHLSISCTLFCYFLARRNVLECIHVMRRLAKERQDAIDA